MPMLNVCATDSVNRRNKTQIEAHRKKHRYSIASSSSSYYRTPSMSCKNSSIEALFSRLLDALIFTSAIAITAYTYVTGALILQQAPKAITHPPSAATTQQLLQTTSSNRICQNDGNSSGSGARRKSKHRNEGEPSPLSHTQHYYHHHHRHQRQHTHFQTNQTDHQRSSTSHQQFNVYPVTMDETKKKRTQEWAEDQFIIHPMAPSATFNTLLPLENSYSGDHKLLYSASNIQVQPLPSASASSTDKNNQKAAMKREERKRRTRSLPVTKLEKEDELLCKVQSLIQQGQQALIS